MQGGDVPWNVSARVRAFLKPVSAFDGLVGRPGTVTADKFSVVSSGRYLEYVSLAIPRNSRHSVSSIHKDCTEPRYHALYDSYTSRVLYELVP